MKKLIYLAFIAIGISFALSSCSKNDTANPVTPKTYVIVHGAWQGPAEWLNVKAGLEAKGQKVILIQLAGHESDQTDPSKITMDVYTSQVVNAVNAVSGKVILVGHSLGGMVVSAVAEKIPAKIEKLIYIAAYVPASGQSLLDLASMDAGSLLGPAITFPTKFTLDVPHDKITNIFIQDGTTVEMNMALANYKVEPAIPFTQPVTLTATNYGAVDKYYIHTLQDHAISPAFQKTMVAAAGIKATYQLNTSHSPFISKPDSVTTLLINIAK